MRLNRGKMIISALLALLWLVTACAPEPAATVPTQATISRQIATVFISPTPDAAEIQQTRSASSPTPAPPTPTVDPTATPYVGVFIGRAEREPGFRNFTAPLFEDETISINPAADPSRCGIQIAVSFLPAWRSDSRVTESMRCPIQASFGFFGEAQVFENGIIYRRPETRELWAVTSSGNFGRYWYAEAPPAADTGDIQPPPSLLIPEGDFAAIWLGIEGLRDELGYAVTPAQEIEINLQRFSGGTFLLDKNAGQTFALVVDGTVYGPFNAPPNLATATPGITIFTPTPDLTGTQAGTAP